MRTNYAARWLATAFASLIAVAAWSVDLPEAPAGYEWYVFEAGKGAYLKPNGWFVKVESDKGTDALFISRENIDKKGSFKTGLSLNVVHDLKLKAGRTPSEYAVGYVASLTELYKPIESIPVPANSGMTGFFVRYRDASRRPAIMIASLIVADDETDTLRIALFEAPERDWEQAWAHGERMLKGQIWR